MDELEISGRRYISSVRAAKEHKYHSDYIGQLVRGGKVVGQKVGRAWYVDADSLAEYLGKEVPPRGPMPRVKEKIPALVVEEVVTKVESVGSGEKLVAEPAEVRDFSPDLSEEETKREFIMPLRKSGRLHRIEAIDAPVTKSPEKIIEPEVIAEEIKIVEAPEEGAQEEENFIPLKITKEPVRNIYAEPEDSFYKVSSKGLRYVQPRENVRQEPVRKTRSKSTRVFAAVGLVLAAGVFSLGVGVLMAYYLHATATVGDAGQTSSVILSNY